MKFLSPLILLLVASAAMATGNSNNSDTNLSADADATATASHNGNTTSSSVANGGNAVAGGGSAVANGGKADSTSVSGAVSGSTVKNDNTDVNVNGQSQTAKGGNSDQSQIGINEQGQSQQSKTSTSTVQGQGQVNGNSDNEQQTEVNVEGDTYQQVRQAPSIAQGSFAIQGCGAAGNAGGTNSHGSAFLGFGFTPAECYAFLLAQSYQAVGETKSACLVLNSTNAAKRAAKRGVKLPSCEAELVITAEPALGTRFVTKEELLEHERRIVKAVAKK